MLLWVWCLSAGHSTLLAPCARSPASDPCQIAAAAQRDKRSPGEPTDLAGGNWGKGSKWFKWQNHPMGITGGDNGQQSWPRRGGRREKGLIRRSPGETIEQLPHPHAECHSEESRARCTHQAAGHVPSALGERSGHRSCSVQPASSPSPPLTRTTCLAQRMGWKIGLSMALWYTGYGP